MRIQLNRTLMTLALVGQSALFALSGSVPGFAQPNPAPAVQQAEPDDEGEAPLEQFALTQKQIEAVLAAQGDIGTIMAGIPEDQADNPDAKTQAALDKASKRFGFKDFDDYEDVVDNIILVLNGFDLDTKTYVGQEVVLKNELAEINADKTMRPIEKKAAIKEVKDLLKAVEPVKFPENIALVTKYFEKLSAVFADNG
jgi:hypothetical protein